MAYLNNRQQKTLKRAREIIRVLDHPERERILEIISTNKNFIPVTDIGRELNLELELSRVSEQLAMMRAEGLVTSTKIGNRFWYKVNHNLIKDLFRALKHIPKPPAKK